jgi:2-hydroxycyclohexanecarboxyl-CoA dehydrogenase
MPVSQARDAAPVRRAFVTGAARGIGAAIAARLAACGRDVVVADIDADGAYAIAERIAGRGIALDVTDARRVGEAVAETGPFDIVVNNAGADQHAFFTDTGEADWRRLLDVNLVSVLAVAHAVLPRMQAARYGRIVNIVSEAARLGSKGGSVYAAAKGGVVAFTKSIARENARFGITANCVAPGPIDTPMLRAGVAQGGEELLAGMTGATLMRRLGTPEEVAAAVAFLASDEAAYITGETLGVSGGMGLGAG